MIDQVKNLYERRPYPHYPLYAKPRWQDGYLGSQVFSSMLSGQMIDATAAGRFLSIGCGEILPYVIRKWESSRTELTCVDLSQRSLNRAKVRCFFLPGKMNFVCQDINRFFTELSPSHEPFDHMEAYGVIHHIQNFSTTISHMSRHLAPHGTMRIMVYNADARSWIWQINRALRQLGLTYHKDDDVDLGYRLLQDLAGISPLLHHRLAQMGQQSLRNRTRFADTFLHPWESRANLSSWLKVFESSGLESYGLFDRYAELDDLENPLWKMPTAKELDDRAADFRFENNLEIWLRRRETTSSAPILTSDTSFNSMKILGAPSSWRRFPETKALSVWDSQVLWFGLLDAMKGRINQQADALILRLPLVTAQRLARIGAISRPQAERLGRIKQFLARIHKSMSPPELPNRIKIEHLVQPIVKGSFPNVPISKFEIACKRLERVI